MSSNTSVVAPLVIQNSGRWLGNDGSWSTFYVHVGTPPQHFHVLPSFGGQTLYVPIAEDCARLDVADCGKTRGVEVFGSRPSLGFQRNASSTWDEIGIYRVAQGERFGFKGNAYYAYETMGPSTSGTVQVPTFEKLGIAAYATPDLWLGRLGLSMFALNMSATNQPHSFLSRLKEGGYIPSLSFGFQAGAPYRFTRVPGSLILGGYDRARHSTKSLLLPSTSDTIIGLQSIVVSPVGGTGDITLLGEGIIALLDTNVAELWLPPSVCDAFSSAFNLTYDETAQRYSISETARRSLRDSSPVFRFKIGRSINGGETLTLELPYAAFDLQASQPIFPNLTYYFPLRRAANDSQYALGRAFLQEVYLSVDWERDEFNISQAVFTSPPPEPDVVTILPKDETEALVPRPGPVPNEPSSISPGAIAGIVVGGVVLIGLLATFGWWRLRRAKRAKSYATQAPEDEKKFPSDPVSRLGGGHTDLELGGAPLVEMYAPHGASEIQQAGSRTGQKEVELVEIESPEPVYELASQASIRR